MLKRKLIFMGVVLFMFGLVIYSFAEMDSAEHHSSGDKHNPSVPATQISVSSANQVQNVGNKVCPVSGEEIEEETKATYEYNGKVYNFCCGGCIGEFKANPAKYIKIIEQEKSNSQSIANK